MVGDRRPDAGDFLTSVLAGGVGKPPETGMSRLDETLHTWSGFGEDADGAWGQWRAMRSLGFASGPSGPASWDEVEDARDGRIPGVVNLQVLDRKPLLMLEYPIAKSRLDDVIEEATIHLGEDVLENVRRIPVILSKPQAPLPV